MPQSNLTDEQLVALVRKEDKEQYSEIIQRYKTKLSHYLRKFIQTNDELEDVLQEVFIKTYRNLNAFNINKKFSPWIYRIAHNEALNHIKKFNKKTISLDENEWDIMDEKIDLKEKFDRSLARERIEKGLSQLKEKYREPLILYFFEEKSYEEISEIMRIPRSTIGILIMRGKSQLKKYLK